MKCSPGAVPHHTVRQKTCGIAYGVYMLIAKIHNPVFSERKGSLMKKHKPGKVRVGNHSARSNKKGVFRAEHNHRNFDLTNAPHISPDRVNDNKTIMFYPFDEQKQNKTVTSFDEYENGIYTLIFSAQLAKLNEKQIQSRHKNKVKTMDKFRRTRNYCPEEDLITLGNNENSVTGDLLWEVFTEYYKWHMEKFPQCILLDAALHLDEPNAAPHVHLRKVWLATAKEQAEHELEVYLQNKESYTRKKRPEVPDKDYFIVHQQASLRQMGIERPDTSKPEGQHNNSKQTYSFQCRQKLIELAQAKNIPLELTPKPSDETGLGLLKYKLYNTEQQLQEAEKNKQILQQQLADTLRLVNENKKEVEDLQQKLAEKSDELAELIHTLENPLPATPKKPTKKLFESEDEYEKRITADVKYQTELADYYAKLEQIPAVISIRKRLRELEDMQQNLQKVIDDEVRNQTQTYYDKRLLEFIKELKKIKLSDADESLYDLYTATILTEKQTLPEHLYEITEREPDKPISKQQEIEWD